MVYAHKTGGAFFAACSKNGLQVGVVGSELPKFSRNVNTAEHSLAGIGKIAEFGPSATAIFLSEKDRIAGELESAGYAVFTSIDTVNGLAKKMLGNLELLDPTNVAFGPWCLKTAVIFAKSDTARAFVNLKPVVEGHALVSPHRKVARFADLSPHEVADLMILVQRCAKMIQEHYSLTSCTLCIQDGPLSGQTVPHVHVHILPRREGDFTPNDAIYDALEEKVHVDEEARKPRTKREMAEEAAMFRKELYGSETNLYDEDDAAVVEE